MENWYIADQNQRRSTEFHLFFEEYPSVKIGQKVYKKTTVAERGTIYEDTGQYEDTAISTVVDLNLAGRNQRWDDMYFAARSFLLGCTKLYFCDAYGLFYKVKNVTLGDVERYSEIAGDFDVKFICEPGVYLDKGCFEYSASDLEIKYNSYSESHPTYLITGNGTCTLTVNGKSMKATVGQNLTVDTDRMLAYRKDGTMMNTAVTGDYEDLYLQPGENDIKITSGFTLKVIPNWRCL